MYRKLLVGTDNHSGLFHNPTSDLSMANNAISFVTFFFLPFLSSERNRFLFLSKKVENEGFEGLH